MIIFLTNESAAHAQQLNENISDTVPVTTLKPELINIFQQKNPKKYKVKEVKVTGNKFFDEALLLSVSGLNVGDEIVIPGGDDFSKAITKLWQQNYFSDVAVYITDMQGDEISLEISVTERPRLSTYKFEGIKKSETEELSTKSGLVVVG